MDFKTTVLIKIHQICISRLYSLNKLKHTQYQPDINSTHNIFFPSFQMLLKCLKVKLNHSQCEQESPSNVEKQCVFRMFRWKLTNSSSNILRFSGFVRIWCYWLCIKALNCVWDACVYKRVQNRSKRLS